MGNLIGQDTSIVADTIAVVNTLVKTDSIIKADNLIIAERVLGLKALHRNVSIKVRQISFMIRPHFVPDRAC